MRKKPSKNSHSWVAEPADADQRLDLFCASRIGSISRNQIQRINDNGYIKVDGEPRASNYHLKGGETITLVIPDTGDENAAPQPEDIPLRIVFEDDHIVVINKDADLVAHPAYGNRTGTVVNGLLGRGTELSSLGSPDRPGVVHRLDKDTTGLMVLAKSDEAYGHITKQMKSRDVHKVYHAIAWGNLGIAQQTIEAPITRHPVHRQKMAVARRGGKPATTEVIVVDSFQYFDYIRVITLTGRTHQIRVHLSHISHSILGDAVYGGRRKKGLPSSTRVRNRIEKIQKIMTRQALHASALSFVHPVTGTRLSFRTALPQDMQQVLELLHAENWTKEAWS